MISNMFRMPVSLARRLVLFAGLILAIGSASQIQAQFSSGSTGADGPFAPLSNQTLQIPASGVFNFTTVNIPSNVTITFTNNAKNTPVTILATGDVTILGVIDIRGSSGSSTVSNGFGVFTTGGTGGPGGFNGGGGGANSAPFFNGLPGDGPGGGGGGAGNGVDTASGGGGGHRTAGTDGSGPFDLKGKGGLTYGAATAQTLIGGSGGGGSSGFPNSRGTGGGGGGGAILIASSGKIIFQAQNSTGGIYFFGGSGGGPGSGGAVRLIASTISGTPDLRNNENQIGTSGSGFVRIEAFQFENHSTTSTYSYGMPSSPVMPNPPQLQITKVAGQNTPANPSGSFNGPSDVVLPTTQTNPVTIEISATNVPVGTAVQLNVISETAAPKAVQSSALDSTGKATANVTLPQGRTLITATVVVQLTSGTTSAVTRPPLFINGEKIDRIEVTAGVDGQSDVTYVSTSGHKIKKVE